MALAGRYQELGLNITRREFCEGTAAIALATALLGSSAFTGFGQALAQKASEAELLKPNPLGEMVLGDAKAPVTVIEYASMTCPHCAHFSETTLPELKKRYIDTGKVRYMLREFPLDPLAAAGFLLARCAAKDDANKYYAMVDTLFRQQNTWVVQQPINPLRTITRQAGLSDKDFDTCLANQPMLDKMEVVRRDASQKLGVNSTPTFFINGDKLSGALSIEDMAKAIDAYLKAG
jgi:protein-disulfide isomerase